MYKYFPLYLKKMGIILAGILFCFNSNAFDAEQCQTPLKTPHVAFIVPTDSLNYFWNNTLILMKNASKQLGIRLTVHYINDIERSRFNYPQTIEKLIDVEDKPDFLISYFWIGAEKRILDVISKHKVKLFSINTPLGEVKDLIGQPREKYPLWIGHMSPNDYQVGYDLADYIIKEAIKRNKGNEDKIYRMVAINGKQDSDVSKFREQGLRARLAESANVELLQMVNSTWTPESGELLMGGLIKRYHALDMVWSASDNMTIGIVKAIDEHALNLKKSIVVGSIDWSKQIISLIETGDVDVSFGGHVLDGSSILTLIYDYFNGQDFVGDVVGNNRAIHRSTLWPVTLSEVEKITQQKLSEMNFIEQSICAE